MPYSACNADLPRVSPFPTRRSSDLLPPGGGLTASGLPVGPTGKKTFVTKTAEEPLAKASTTRAGFEAVENGKPARAESTTTTSVATDRKSTRLNSSHHVISYAVFCM